MTDELSLQEKYGPEGVCFGCGPKNEKGLQIQSYPSEEVDGELILHFEPEDHHRAFNNVMNGGIIGALFDCHQNWTSAMALYNMNSDQEFPSTVTYQFEVKLLKPTPADKTLVVKAKPVSIDGNKVHTEAKMYVDDTLMAESEGTFIQVKEGHPAFHRWD